MPAACDLFITPPVPGTQNVTPAPGVNYVIRAWPSVPHGLSRDGVEEQLPVVVAMLEVEHRDERSGDGVEGAADPRQPPVVLDEPEGGTLVGDVVRDEVALGEGRDDQQRQARPVAAPAVLAGQRRVRGGVPAQARAGQ